MPGIGLILYLIIIWGFTKDKPMCYLVVKTGVQKSYLNPTYQVGE
jgi:hypothetical protein